MPKSVKTIRIVKQYNYGVMTCAVCKDTKSYHSVHGITGKAADTRLPDLQRYARDDGWTQNRRRQWICSNCSKVAAESEATQ